MQQKQKVNNEKILTYKNKLDSVEDIYKKIQDTKPFTIKGYQFTINLFWGGRGRGFKSRHSDQFKYRRYAVCEKLQAALFLLFFLLFHLLFHLYLKNTAILSPSPAIFIVQSPQPNSFYLCKRTKCTDFHCYFCVCPYLVSILYAQLTIFVQLYKKHIDKVVNIHKKSGKDTPAA